MILRNNIKHQSPTPNGFKGLRTYVGTLLGSHQVIVIDNFGAYMANLFGPRIRMLVRDLKTLSQSVVLPILDGEGVVEYKLEYIRLPNQCGRCRSTKHLVVSAQRRTSN
jgi:hypothetical protein